MTFTIPDPTSVANNLFQIADTWKKWQAQAKDAKAQAHAQVLVEVNLLVGGMHAYADGYRQLRGEFQDFRPDWKRRERRAGAAHYRAWIDPRGISDQIHQHLSTLREVESKGEYLDENVKKDIREIIHNAEYFLGHTAYPLLRIKELPDDRARVINALANAHTAEEAEPVADWASDTQSLLDASREQLASANEEVGRLTAKLTALNQFRELPRKLPWYKRFLSPFRNFKIKLRTEVGDKNHVT